MNFTVSESHSLKIINPIRYLKDALELSKKADRSVTHIAVVEDNAKCDSFGFDEAEGIGKRAATAHTGIQMRILGNLSHRVVCHIGCVRTGRRKGIGNRHGHLGIPTGCRCCQIRMAVVMR